MYYIMCLNTDQYILYFFNDDFAIEKYPVIIIVIFPK